MSIKSVFEIGLLLLLFSCHSKEKETRKLIQSWQGKEIIFPATLHPQIFNRDVN